MKRRTRLGGGSLGLRLVALVLVPMATLTTLAYQRVDVERASAEQSESVAEAARLRSALISIYGPAQLEQVAVEGLAQVDELEIDRASVRRMYGIDLVARLTVTAEELDRQLDVLVGEHGDVRLASGQTIQTRFAPIRGYLAGERLVVANQDSDPRHVRVVFDKLYDALDEGLRDSRPYSIGDTGAPIATTQLDRLGAMLRVSSDRGQAIFDSVLHPDTKSMTAIVSAGGALELTTELFTANLSEADALDFEATRTALQGIRTSNIAALGVDDVASEEPIVAVSETLLDHLAYVRALSEFSAAYHDHFASGLEADAVAAHRRAMSTTLVVLGIAIASLILVLLSVLSSVTPLRRLSERASDIGHGELGGQPLPIRGPRDIRAVTVAMNEMTDTLRQLDSTMGDMASGEPATDSLGSLPGPIGASLRASVERIEMLKDELRRSEQLSSAIVAEAGDAIWTIEADGGIRSANNASALLTGVSSEDQIGEPLARFLGSLAGETTLVGVCGSRTPMLVTSNTIDSGSGPLTTVIAHDISARARHEDELAHQVRNDALTNLPNRFAVMEHLDALAQVPGETYSILFIDLDGFKEVNDTLGHAEGDRVLSTVAERLSRTIRADEFLGRLGGDEFVVVTRGLSIDDAVGVGRRIVTAIEEPMFDDAGSTSISASVGVAQSGLDAVPTEVLRRADRALYAAKERGRGCVIQHDAESMVAPTRRPGGEHVMPGVGSTTST